jgi:hypothetical protein
MTSGPGYSLYLSSLYRFRLLTLSASFPSVCPLLCCLPFFFFPFVFVFFFSFVCRAYFPYVCLLLFRQFACFFSVYLSSSFPSICCLFPVCLSSSFASAGASFPSVCLPLFRLFAVWLLLFHPLVLLFRLFVCCYSVCLLLLFPCMLVCFLSVYLSSFFPSVCCFFCFSASFPSLCLILFHLFVYIMCLSAVAHLYLR